MAVALLLSVLTACRPAGAREHDSLTAGAEPLRAHFNRDVGSVRIVMLVAPT